MVNETARWALIYTQVNPFTVAEVCGVPQQECWDFMAEIDLFFHDEEVFYRSGADQRRIDLQEFIDEVPNKKEIKRRSLLERIRTAKSQNRSQDIIRLLAEFNALDDRRVELTPQQVLKAKSCPIRGILGVDRVGNISCPFHEDKKPSFQIKKNNTFTCFSCQVFGDSIDLYQRIHNCDFRTAVTMLQ